LKKRKSTKISKSEIEAIHFLTSVQSSQQETDLEKVFIKSLENKIMEKREPIPDTNIPTNINTFSSPATACPTKDKLYIISPRFLDKKDREKKERENKMERERSMTDRCGNRGFFAKNDILKASSYRESVIVKEKPKRKRTMSRGGREPGEQLSRVSFVETTKNSNVLEKENHVVSPKIGVLKHSEDIGREIEKPEKENIAPNTTI